jgi:hypothetical protein
MDELGSRVQAKTEARVDVGQWNGPAKGCSGTADGDSGDPSRSLALALAGHDRVACCARERRRCFRFMRAGHSRAKVELSPGPALTRADTQRPRFVGQSGLVGPCASGQAPLACHWLKVSDPCHVNGPQEPLEAGGPWIFSSVKASFPFSAECAPRRCGLHDLRFGRRCKSLDRPEQAPAERH